MRWVINLTSKEQVDLYAGAGDPVAKNPSGTAGSRSSQPRKSLVWPLSRRLLPTCPSQPRRAAAAVAWIVQGRIRSGLSPTGRTAVSVTGRSRRADRWVWRELGVRCQRLSIHMRFCLPDQFSIRRLSRAASVVCARQHAARVRGERTEARRSTAVCRTDPRSASPTGRHASWSRLCTRACGRCRFRLRRALQCARRPTS